MFIHLTSEQYDNLRHKLEADTPNKDIISSSENGPYNGIIDTHDVTMQYYYDPAQQRANVELIKRKSLAAKLAPENVILTHIVEAVHTFAVTAPAGSDQMFKKDPQPETVTTNSLEESATQQADEAAKAQQTQNTQPPLVPSPFKLK